jgi:hypothetical protein
VTTWEQRMSQRAAERRAITEADHGWTPPPRNELDELAIRERASVLREHPEWRQRTVDWACACVGPLSRGQTLCGCHVHEEALAAIEDRECRWCANAHQVS